MYVAPKTRFTYNIQCEQRKNAKFIIHSVNLPIFQHIDSFNVRIASENRNSGVLLYRNAMYYIQKRSPHHNSPFAHTKPISKSEFIMGTIRI